MNISDAIMKHRKLKRFQGGIQGIHILTIGMLLYILGFLLGWSMDGINFNESRGPDGGSILNDPLLISKSGKLIKDIFLNNMGLNSLIMIGAFSLLGFSLIIISFNAVQIGFLVKGLYTSYGIRTSVTLVLPHLVFELLSQMLSLYLAYLLLNNVIMSLIFRERTIELTGEKVVRWIVLLIAMIVCAFVGAWIEIRVTPALL